MTTLAIDEIFENSKVLGGIAAWYGLRARPFSLACQPKGQSAVFTKEQALELFPQLKDNNNTRHGAITYPAPLTGAQIQSFELVPLNKEHGIELAHVNSIPTSDLQVLIIDLLAKEFLKVDAEIQEYRYLLEDDDGHELRQAFKQTAIFKNRKESPAQIEEFNECKECLKEIHPDAVIARIKLLIEKAA